MEYHLILLYALCPIRYALQIRNPQSKIRNLKSESLNRHVSITSLRHHAIFILLLFQEGRGSVKFENFPVGFEGLLPYPEPVARYGR